MAPIGEILLVPLVIFWVNQINCANICGESHYLKWRMNMNNIFSKVIAGSVLGAMAVTPMIAHASNDKDSPKENYQTIMDTAMDEDVDKDAMEFLVAVAHQETRGENLEGEDEDYDGFGVFNLTTKSGDVDDLMDVEEATLIMIDKIEDADVDFKDMDEAYKEVMKTSVGSLKEKSIDFGEDVVKKYMSTQDGDKDYQEKSDSKEKGDKKEKSDDDKGNKKGKSVDERKEKKEKSDE